MDGVWYGIVMQVISVLENENGNDEEEINIILSNNRIPISLHLCMYLYLDTHNNSMNRATTKN